MAFNYTPKEAGVVNFTYTHEWDDAKNNLHKKSERTVSRDVLDVPQRLTLVAVKHDNMSGVKLFDMDDLGYDEYHNSRHSYLISTNDTQDKNITYTDDGTKETWLNTDPTQIWLSGTPILLSQEMQGTEQSLNSAFAGDETYVDDRAIYLEITKQNLSNIRKDITYDLELIDKTYAGKYNKKIVVPLRFFD